MTVRIPHGQPTLPGPQAWGEVTSRLAPGWCADGPCVEQFEQAAAGWLGCPAGVAVGSGSTALQLALLAVGAGPGREVVIPSYCCAALLNAVALTGATPILGDSEPDGFQLCPADTSSKITSRTAAVVVAHLFGEPAPLEPFLELGVPIVEDCAQSLGARESGVLTGGRGCIAITSFYATKVVTTGHGGLVACRDPDLLAQIRDLVEYDNREDWKPRFSCRMSELQAAQGLWQLERLPAFLARRRDLATRHDAALAQVGSPRCSSPREEGAIFFRYILRVPDADAVLAALQARGVGARRPVYQPLHRYFPELQGAFRHAEAAHREIVSLPLYPTLTDEDADEVMESWMAVRAGPVG